MTPDTLTEWDPIARRKSTLADHPNQATTSKRRVLVLEWEATRLRRAPWIGAIFCQKRLQSGNGLPTDDTRVSRISSQSNANKSERLRNSLELAEDGRVLARYGK